MQKSLFLISIFLIISFITFSKTQFRVEKARALVHHIEVEQFDKAMLHFSNGFYPKLSAYHTGDTYKQIKFSLRSGKYSLPATLTVPNEGDSFPLVIMIPDLGSKDENSSIGPNKPFSDLAIGLASKGIASVRFFKRNKIYKDEIAALDNYTPNEETIADALAAIEVANSDEFPYLDANNIYLLGHGFGGKYAPQIAEESGKIKGIVMLAAHAIALEEIAHEQVLHLISSNGFSEEGLLKITQSDSITKAIKSGNLAPDTPLNILPFGLKYSFWQDLKNYDPINTAKSLNLPIYFLHGERDFEVSVTENLRLWKEMLDTDGSSLYQYKSYPKLNHYFMEGKGIGGYEEYERPSNIPLYVIEDLVNWINLTKK